MRYSFLAFAVLGLIALGGVWFYGQAQYKGGYKQCELEQSKAVIQEDKKRDVKREKARVKVAKTNDIDCELFDHGWLREQDCK